MVRPSTQIIRSPVGGQTDAAQLAAPPRTEQACPSGQGSRWNCPPSSQWRSWPPSIQHESWATGTSLESLTQNTEWHIAWVGVRPAVEQYAANAPQSPGALGRPSTQWAM